jgi:NAD(P)-dependent dehydrogenase (short-subunit alcohol dehydrogenase family)
MHGKICLITGATDGVGRATALALARQGFTVVMAARNAAKAEVVMQEIARVTGHAAADHIAVDLSSLQQTRALAETFRRRYARLDVLVNNAGVFLARRSVTADGFETTYQVNYLAHFLLTQLLLEQLQGSPQGRVINLSSSVHAVARFDPSNLQSEKKFSLLGTYAASKLFMLMFTEELARRLAGSRVTANAVHPGIVRTRMMRQAPGAFRLVSYLSMPFSISPEEGARTPAYLATAPELSQVSGQYFAGSRPAEVKNRFDTPENRALLWDLSARSVGA